MRSRIIRPVCAATIAVLSLTATACGGSQASEPSSEVASIGDDGSTTDSTPDGTADGSGGDVDAPSDPAEAGALFDACMEDQGIEQAAPTGDGLDVADNAVGDEVDPQSGASFSDEELDAAVEKCEFHLANVDDQLEMSPEQEAALADAEAAFNACMSDLGIDLGDTGDDGGISVEMEAADPQDDANAEKFEAFQEASNQCAGVFDDIFDDTNASGVDE